MLRQYKFKFVAKLNIFSLLLAYKCYMWSDTDSKCTSTVEQIEGMKNCKYCQQNIIEKSLHIMFDKLNTQEHC